MATMDRCPFCNTKTRHVWEEGDWCAWSEWCPNPDCDWQEWGDSNEWGTSFQGLHFGFDFRDGKEQETRVVRNADIAIYRRGGSPRWPKQSYNHRRDLGDIPF